MIGVSCPNLCFERLEDILPRLADNNCVWEFLGEGNLRLPDIVDELNDLLPSYDIPIQLHAPFSDMNMASLNPKVVDMTFIELEEQFMAAKEVGIDVITVHPGIVPPVAIDGPAPAIAQNLKSMKRLDRLAQDLDVKLSLENMPNFWMAIGKDLKEFMPMLEETELGVCFDIGHANTNDALEEFMTIQDRFTNVHLHDNFGRSDQHLPLGKGSIDFEKWLPRVMDGYHGNLIVESRTLEDGLWSLDVLRALL